MQQAPDWLTWASRGVAAVSLLVSAATYRRAGPRVRVRAKTTPGWKPGTDEDVSVTVVVSNAGLAPAQIYGLHIAARVSVAVIRSLALTNQDMYEGPPLPCKLEAGSREKWVVSLRETVDRALAASGITRSNLSLRALFRLLFPGGDDAAKVGIHWWSFFFPIFAPGVIIAVELGNGVTVTSRPLYRLLWYGLGASQETKS